MRPPSSTWLTGLAAVWWLVGALAGQPAAAGPALLIDAGTGRVLYAEDQDQLWHPASLTKIMTAYITFEALRDGKLTLDSKIATSAHANAMPASKIGLPVGAEMSVELALQALIVKSANDVAVMLAEAIESSVDAFAARMNATARRLGMTRTHFVNPNGLPEAAQVTTARDLALLSQAVFRDFPQYAAYWAQPYVRVGKYRLGSHNALLKTFDGSTGIKTGFICDSGFNIVASATRGDLSLVAVVLGEDSGRSREERARGLLEHGFKLHGWKLYLGAPTLDALALADTAATAPSIRTQIRSWDCGNRPAAQPRRAVRRKKRKGEATAKATANVAQPASASAAATPAPSPTKAQ